MWEGINKKGEGIIFSQLSGLLNYQRFEKYLPIIYWIKRGEVYKNIEIQWGKRQGQEECSRITLVRVHAMDTPFWLWAKQIIQLFRRAQTRWRSCWCHHGCKNYILYIHFSFCLIFLSYGLLSISMGHWQIPRNPRTIIYERPHEPLTINIYDLINI